MTENAINERLPYVVPEITDWPIYKLSQDKEGFLNQILQKTEEDLLEKFNTSITLHNELKSILYQEKNRLTKEPWKSDKPEEKVFWSEIKRKVLLSSKEDDEDERYKNDKKTLQKILRFYADEIVANFDPKTYKMARTVLPWVFGRLMNASPGEKLKFLSLSNKTIYDKIKITGPIEHIRSLAQKGTVVIVPTHFSNLDSPTIGFIIDIIGLPAMTYGAGINLFTMGLISKWMNNLGAYKLDRRKKNSFYMELLKNYSNIALQRGAHSLFFPGGTRSRSGRIEDKLKLGLLSTAIEAQRQNLIKFPEETAQKIFIVPVVLNYHFVMEAASLINQHLSMEGKEKYISEKEQLSTSYHLVKLLYKFLTATPGMTISFATPMDVFGNEIDEDGNSINNIGQKVHIKDYFLLHNQLSEDRQRDGVYTSMLADKIVQKFKKYNTVLTSHLLAYVAFEMIKREYKHLDLFELLRIPSDEIEIDFDQFKIEISRINNYILEMYADKKLLISNKLMGDAEFIIKHGLKNLGVYHSLLPLLKNNEGKITTQDLRLLYFYHNRLEGYGLSKHF
jgi:glycerol-3-phosphate O-acyltransferase